MSVHTSSAFTSLLASKSLNEEGKRKKRRKHLVLSRRRKRLSKEKDVPFVSNEHDDHVRAGMLSGIF